MNRDAWAEQVAREVYDVLKARLGRFRDFVVLRRRTRDLIQDHGGDAHMVAAVLLAAARSTHDIFVDMGPVAFVHRRDAMGVPDGAWRFAHEALREGADPDVAASADHWLALWRDAEREGDMDLQMAAQARLEELYREGEVGL